MRAATSIISCTARPARPRGGSLGAEVALNGTFNSAPTFNVFYTFNWPIYCALYGATQKIYLNVLWPFHPRHCTFLISANPCGQLGGGEGGGACIQYKAKLNRGRKTDSL